jgi:hypothetical protein
MVSKKAPSSDNRVFTVTCLDNWCLEFLPISELLCKLEVYGTIYHIFPLTELPSCLVAFSIREIPMPLSISFLWSLLRSNVVPVDYECPCLSKYNHDSFVWLFQKLESLFKYKLSLHFV